MCAVALVLVPLFAFGPALHPSFFQRDARMKAAAAAVAAVPAGVTVEAVNHLGPQLSARDTVLLWDGDGSSPLRPPWVVADVAKWSSPSPAASSRSRRVALLERSGYQIVFQGRVSRDAPCDARQAADETPAVNRRLGMGAAGAGHGAAGAPPARPSVSGVPAQDTPPDASEVFAGAPPARRTAREAKA